MVNIREAFIVGIRKWEHPFVSRTQKEITSHVPPPKVKGGILVSVRIPGVGVTDSCMHEYMECHQTYMDISLEQAKELIRFW